MAARRLLAKLDSNGQALWIRNIDGGLDYTKRSRWMAAARCDHFRRLLPGVINGLVRSAWRQIPPAVSVWRRVSRQTERLNGSGDYLYTSTVGAVEVDATVAANRHETSGWAVFFTVP